MNCLNSTCLSKFDPGVFFLKAKDEISGIVCLHVDDFFWTGNQHFEELVSNSIKTVFSVGDESSMPLRYLGLQNDRRQDGFIIDQNDYHEKLSEILIKRREDDKVYDKNEPTTTGQKFAMRSLLGKLLWLSVQTRPEIGSELSRLSMRISTSNVGDIACLNKIARSVKIEPSELKVANIGCQDAWKLVVFTDASLANNSDCSTQSGYLVFLMNSDNGKFSLLA